jgi:hypothetical protein
MSAQDTTNVDREILNCIRMISHLDVCISCANSWIKCMLCTCNPVDDYWRAEIAETQESINRSMAKKSEYEARLALLISGCGPS